jgi:uncharacterized membrane protein YraQ (UPF0718 family)
MTGKSLTRVLKILLIGLMKSFISFESIASIFTQNKFIDTAIGALLGSILAGNSINSYIIGHELIIGGVSLFAVTAFLIAWVTVGFIQYFILSLLGTVSHGPIYAWYPLMNNFHEKGVHYDPIASFLYAGEMV